MNFPQARAGFAPLDIRTPMTTDTAGTEATPVTVTFTLFSPGARVVYLAVFFNNWSAELPCPRAVIPGTWQGKSQMMVRHLVPLGLVQPGLWGCALPLLPGWHEYLFLVDQTWVLDPDAAEVCPDGAGGFNAARMVEPVPASHRILPPPVGHGAGRRSVQRRVI